MYERFARAYELPKPHRTLEWGVGGGANAICFAPISGEFIAVDVAQQSLDETVRQVRSECASSVTPVLVSTSTHYAEVTGLAGSVDLFLCFYVLELVPTEAHAFEIIDMAYRLLKPGGAAILQAKYKSSASGFRPWAHLSARLGNMCIIDIPRLWAQLESTGFIVRYVELVPHTRLDRNYAYFFATKPE
jgi:ubiquinone/menaquinone biosynthesis C-methylase UbiE